MNRKDGDNVSQTNRGSPLKLTRQRGLLKQAVEQAVIRGIFHKVLIFGIHSAKVLIGHLEISIF